MTIITYSKLSKKTGENIHYLRWQGYKAGKTVQKHIGRADVFENEIRANELEIAYLTEIIENTKNELYLRKQRLEQLKDNVKEGKETSTEIEQEIESNNKQNEEIAVIEMAYECSECGANWKKHFYKLDQCPVCGRLLCDAHYQEHVKTKTLRDPTTGDAYDKIVCDHEPLQAVFYTIELRGKPLFSPHYERDFPDEVVVAFGSLRHLLAQKRIANLCSKRHKGKPVSTLKDYEIIEFEGVFNEKNDSRGFLATLEKELQRFTLKDVAQDLEVIPM